MDWKDLEGCKIKQVTWEGDLEFAKQNGIDKQIYLILDKGMATLDIKFDERTKEPYIAII